MLSKKTKGLFVEVNGFSYQVAAVSSLTTPLTVESIHDFPRSDPGQLQEFLESATGAGHGRYLHAHCGIVPESRFFRLHTIESMAKAKEDAYFNNVLEQQYRINPTGTRMAAVNALTGAKFNPGKSLANQKSVLLCGADEREFFAFQDNIVECGIYPQSLQLSSLSSVAALKNLLKLREFEAPVLLVEITQNSANLFILTQNRIDLCRPMNFGFNGVLPVIQKELGLKDEDSARDLFFSNTFDFREMGPTLLTRVLKELNAATGFYEVQTGQTISHMYMTSIPENLNWIPEVISEETEIELLDIDWHDWATQIGVTFGDECATADFGPAKFALFSLFVNLQKD